MPPKKRHNGVTIIHRDAVHFYFCSVGVWNVQTVNSSARWCAVCGGEFKLRDDVFTIGRKEILTGHIEERYVHAHKCSGAYHTKPWYAFLPIIPKRHRK